MAKKKSAKKGWNYKLILAIEVVILITLIILYGVWVMNHKMDELDYNNIEEEEIDINEGLDETAMKGYTNIVVFGGDSRSGSVDQGAHSDVIIIVNINNDTKEVRMVSVYRDTFLEIAKENPNNQKLTHAHYIGGAKMAINTLNRNLDLNIKDYVTVNFESVIKAVDLLGGLEITVKKGELKSLNRSIREENKLYGTNVEQISAPGTYLMNGTQVLAYTRIRSTGQGDITRTGRQREVIGLMVKKVKSAGMSTLNKLIDEVFPMISTSISKSEIISLATGVFNYELTDTVGFPFSYGAPNLGSKGSILAPADLLNNVTALHKYLFNEQDYVPSENVKRISASVQAESGVGVKEIDLFKDDSTEAAGSADTQGADAQTQ